MVAGERVSDASRGSVGGCSCSAGCEEAGYKKAGRERTGRAKGGCTEAGREKAGLSLGELSRPREG